MRSSNAFCANKLVRESILGLLFSLLVLALATSAYAQTETILYNFGAYSGDAGGPSRGLIFDGAGNLFGSAGGGASGNGAVFELSPVGGAWNETLLYQFTGGNDGAAPNGNLVFDSAGNLYGTAAGGGTGGHGVVFMLSPGAGGWTETVLYNFTGATDGGSPTGGVVFDTEGNLYGATEQGGNTADCAPYGCGVVFELAPGGAGWVYSVIHTFLGPEGSSPIAGVTFHSGAVFGTTYNGGSANAGVVFEMKRGSGTWRYNVIHNLGGGTNGYFMYAGVIFDAKGNLYSVAEGGGTNYAGAAFEMKPGSGGGWTFHIIYNFTGFKDGYLPSSTLSLDAAGNLYGNAYLGGIYSECKPYGCGTVFKLKPHAGGAWTESTLHIFSGSPDGQWPEESPLVLDSAGNVYGTTTGGGTTGAGTAFEIVP